MRSNSVLLLFGITIGIVLLQLNLTPWIQIGHAKPDLALIGLVFLIRYVSSNEYLFLAFLIGFFQDIFSSNLMGVHMLINVSATYLILFLYLEIVSVTFLINIILILFMLVVKFVLTLLLGKIFFSISFIQYFKQSVGDMIYTLILGPTLILCISWVKERFFSRIS